MTTRQKTLIGFISALWVCFFAAEAWSEEEHFPSPEEIIQAEKRGKEIAEYERVAGKATDTLLGHNPDLAKLGVYVVDKSRDIWIVYFGKVTEAGEKFDAAYIYACSINSNEPMKVVQISSIPKEITLRARAVSVALKTIEFEARVPLYNTSVFREEDGTLTVYLLPGNKNPDVVLLGGDYKISVSADGSKVIGKSILHRGIVEIPTTPKEGRPEGALHTHILDDMPTETDVALILLNPVLAPHSVIGREWFSQIDKNGKITILGKTKEILLN